MILIGSVNIQYASNEKGQTLLSFATPKTNREAMKAAEKAIADDTNCKHVTTQRSPAQYAKDWQYTAWNHSRHLAWICFNEVTVKE